MDPQEFKSFSTHIEVHVSLGKDGRPTQSALWLGVAWLLASRSTCKRRGVGCVLVDSLGQVLSTGYNGVAHGQPHCNERTGIKPLYPKPVMYENIAAMIQVDYPHACAGAAAASGTDLEGCEAIHAEQNALLQCRDVQAIHTVYVTHSPCLHCLKMLLNTGAKRIIYEVPYPGEERARALWEGSRGVGTFQWSQLKPD